ncbi:MAG: hypothetical protein H6559_24905 [Lewinellaceae bacterium]|nr:hypothetical protein [Lewinellaceae bacterium]
MKEWRNPYITLSLPATASKSEISKRAELLGRQGTEEERIARTAKEKLSHNLELIFPAFLTAIPSLSFTEGELKFLRKYNKKSPQFNEETLQDAFLQYKLQVEEEPIQTDELSEGLHALIRSEIGLFKHEDEFKEIEKKEGIAKIKNREIQTKQDSKIRIPVIIKLKEL